MKLASSIYNTKYLLLAFIVPLVTLSVLTKLIHSARRATPSYTLQHTRTITMAWRSSGSSNQGLVTNLAQNGLIESDRVREAMLKVHLHTDIQSGQLIPSLG